MTAIPAGRIEELKQRLLADTGFRARELFGYNYDEDENGTHVNVGNGGIVAHGKMQEIVELLDDRTKRYKLIIAPRESRKSTLAQVYIVGRILENPNIRVLYIGRTDAIVLGKARAIRAQLESPEVVALYGEQVGDQWGETKFTVRGRTAAGLQNPTFTAFSQDSMETGGRFDLIDVDDFIDHTNVTTPQQNNKSKDLFATLQPMLARGGEMVVQGTIWADDDAYADMQASPLFRPPLGGQIVCGAGVRVINRDDGTVDLEELPTGLTFPHLTLDYLRQKLWGMARAGKVGLFCRQYLNEATTLTDSHFQRKHFKSLQWGDDMKKLSGYLLTDTAIETEDPESCYSVCAYVGIDSSDNLYLLDLRVGHWSEDEFCDHFFAMLEEWQPRVNHCGEAWEDVSLTKVFRHHIETDSRARKTRLRTIEMPRGARNKKDSRIKRLQPTLAKGFFYVVSTVPRAFVDLDGTRVLWDPVGHYDPTTKTMQPAGELVDEFIKAGAKKDIPDTLAMILEYRKSGHGLRRLCPYKPWKPPERTASLTERRQEQYRAEEYGSSKDWWQRTLSEHHF